MPLPCLLLPLAIVEAEEKVKKAMGSLTAVSGQHAGHLHLQGLPQAP